MSKDVLSYWKSAEEVVDGPALRLLRKTQAPSIIAILQDCFSAGVDVIPASTMYVRVDAYLDQFDSLGIDRPQGTARQLCSQWVRSEWVSRVLDEKDGSEGYRLASGGLQALRYVQEIETPRTALSGSRIDSVMHAAHTLAARSDPDQDAQLARIDDEIAQLQQRRARIADGHVESASDEEMLLGVENILGLLSSLPADFRRVEETISELRRKALQAFSEDEQSRGDIIGAYLNDSDVATATPEGRAYSEAVELLQDPVVQRSFEADLRTILQHPFAEALLPEEHAAFRDCAKTLRTGVQVVQAARTKASSAIQSHIRSYDQVAEAQLSAVLQELDHLQLQWSPGPWAPVPLTQLPKWYLPNNRVALWDPDLDDTPPPLKLSDPDTAMPSVDTATLMRWGGPRTDEIISQFPDMAAITVEELAELFNALPEDLRRPVEVVGLLSAVDVPRHCEGDPTFHTVRPDGTSELYSLRLDP